jgi:1-aminocyclopropane-1-carboxylate deaminase
MDTPFFQLRWQLFHHPILSQSNTELWICHVDCQVQAAAGNKWLKLKYHIQQIQQHNPLGIVTFGGAFSNHLAAVAAAGKALGFQTKAIVRCHQPDHDNPTLQQCAKNGMELIFVDADKYRQRHQPQYLAELALQYPGFLIVPEGGSSELAAAGFFDVNFAATPSGAADLISCASASGGTVAGIVQQQNRQELPCNVLAIQVVKDASLASKIELLCPLQSALWRLIPEMSGKKYGSFDEATLDFCLEMAEQKIYVEPIYTGKALRTLLDYLLQNPSVQQRRVSFFHTGGLQGLAGLLYQNKISYEQFCKLNPDQLD